MVNQIAENTLVVDLDRTLSRTDLTAENLLAVIAKGPHLIFLVFLWALRGRAHMKAKLAERESLNIGTMPFHAEVVDLLNSAKSQGKRIVLASASNQRIVDDVAEHFGFFDDAWGSSDTENLKSRQKAKFLTERYGPKDYAYIGDSPADINVWKEAGTGFFVGQSKGLLRQAKKANPRMHHIEVENQSLMSKGRAFIKALRPHQWSKNVLLFVSLIAAQAFTLSNLAHALLAFAIFSLTASSVYLLNDMLDLESDRAHPRKNKRPFAAGTLPIKFGVIATPALLIIAFGLSILFLPPLFTLVLLGYYITTVSYSLLLKRRIMVDVITLGALYTFRILAGAAALALPMSPWLIGFSLFFFLALAIVKRMSEIVDMLKRGGEENSRRDYRVEDLHMIQAMGAAAGYGAIILLTLYFSSEASYDIYTSPEILWGVTPLMLYWVSRMLVLSNRGLIGDDPIVFASRDRTSIITGALVVMVILAADLIDIHAWMV